MYYIFETAEEALRGLDELNQQFFDYWKQQRPEEVDERGIIGRNAGTGELDYEAARTTSWALVEEYLINCCFPFIDFSNSRV